MNISNMAFNFDLTTNEFTAPLIHGVQQVVYKLPTVIFGVIVGILLIKLITWVLKMALSYTVAQVGLRDVLVSLTRGILWLFLVIQVLQAFGFNNIIVFFTGSIAAIGIAMAAGGSTLISDIVAGLFLARDADFNVGDEIIAGETPTQGVIAGMDTRRVRLRDADGVLHVIPNSVIERKEWVLVHRRGELNALARAARNIKEAAIEKAAERKAAASKRQVRLRNNDQ